MRKKIVGIILAVFALLVAAPSLSAIPVAHAQNTDPNILWGNQDPNEIGNEIGLGDTRDPRLIAASVIRVLLGFLGIIAVVIILFGGFKWMTAGGNDEKVGEARKLMTQGIVGLIIILAAWGIASFVVDAIFEATSN